MQIKNQHLEPEMEQWTGSELGEEYIKAVYGHPTYLTYIQSSSSNVGLDELQAGPKIAGSNINNLRYADIQFSSIQSLSCVQLFATPWTAARQASLFITNSWSLLKLMSIESVMPSNHLSLCHPLLFQPSIFPSIRVFTKESVLLIRWPKYWSFSFSISPSNEHPGLISFRMDCWLDLLAVQGTLKSLL